MHSIESVVSEIGWDTKYSLPIASAENLKLQNEIQEKEKRISELLVAIEQEKERFFVIKHQVENSSQNLQISQNLYEAKQREVETEANMKRHVQAEVSWLAHTIKDLNKQHQNLKSRSANHQSDILRANKIFEDLSQKIHFDNEAFKHWIFQSAVLDEECSETANSSENGKKVLKEIQVKLGKLSESLASKKKQLENTSSSWQSSRTELKKITDELRKLHQNRQHLLKQCSGAVMEIHLRDKEIQSLYSELSNLKAEVSEGKSRVEENFEILEEEERNNKKFQDEIRNLKITRKNWDAEFEKAKANGLPLDELEAARKLLQNVSFDLDESHQLGLQLDLQIKTKSERISQLKKERDVTQFHLRSLQGEKNYQDDKAVFLGEFLSEEETRARKIEKELEKIEKLRLNIAQDMQRLENDQATTIAGIKGGKTEAQKLSQKVGDYNRKFSLSQEIIAGLDSMLLKLDYRIQRMADGGGAKDAERADLEFKLKQLQVSLEEKIKLKNINQARVALVTKELKQAKGIVDSDTNKRCELQSKHKELEIKNEVLSKELTAADNKRQVSIAEESLLKLEVKRLNDMLLKYFDNVSLLENYSQALNQAIREKNNDISSHMVNLEANLKRASAEKRLNLSKLQDINREVEKIKNTYDSLMKTDGDINEASFVLKAKQEKRELHEQELNLNEKIESAELELTGMENSMELINICNRNLKESFKTDSLLDLQLTEKLEQQLEGVCKENALLETKLAERRAALENSERAKLTSSNELAEVSELVESRKQELQEADLILRGQKEKIDRVTALISKSEKALSKEHSRELNAIWCQHLKEIKQWLYEMLSQLVSNDLSACEKINELLGNAGLQLIPRVTVSQSKSVSQSKLSSMVRSPSRGQSSSAKSQRSKGSCASSPLSVINIDLSLPP